MRNIMYQRNQQQQQPNRDNYNNNNNDDNYDSSESDSDSDAEMEENQADGENEDNIMPENNIENAMVNNEEDEQQQHNDILERIDFQLDNDNEHAMMGSNRENTANIPDDPRPDTFDENSRGNFELPILGESSGCNLNLEIVPPTVNDESSRESMDMDYESDKPTLGNIAVERNPEKIESLERASANANKERNDSDEEANFYENDEFCSFLRNGESDEMNSCKCRKCALKERSHEEFNNCNGVDCCEDLDVCYKRRSLIEETRKSSPKSCPNRSDFSSSSCGKMCSASDEDFSTVKNLDSDDYNISVDRATLSKAIDDKIADYSDDNDMDIEERDVVEKESPASKCTCFVPELDHVNGHSSKMCLELPKRPCEKCIIKNVPSTSAAADADNGKSTEESESEKANENLESANKALNANADADNVENLNQEALNNPVQVVRNRDRDDLDTARPNKRAKLNNGSASSRNKTPRTIFHKALDAVSMSWDNQHLKNILASNTYSINSSNAVQTAGSSKPSQTVLTTIKSNFNSLGQPLWHEPLAMCAARVDSLRSHGHTDAALRLSVSVVRTMKQVQKDAQVIWKRYQAVTNIACHDDIPKKSNNCCCECNKSPNGKNPHGNLMTDSFNHHSTGGNGSSSSGSSSSNSSSRKRSYDSTRNNSNLGYSSSSSSMSNRAGYKMYRFDYGNYHSSYRYGMGNDGCKRCLEARERAGYQNTFNNGYHANRFGMNGSGMQPPYFRNNFAPMHGNMFDQRFGGNSHFGSNSFRYGNNYHPSNMPNNGQCHSDNCNVMHRQQQNHHIPMNNGNVGNDGFGNNVYNNSRPHCSRDAMDGGHNPHNPHGNYNNGSSATRRCSHDLKLREMINAPMQQPRPIPNDSRNSHNNCRSCDNKKHDEPSTSAMANASASAPVAGPSTSSSSASAGSSSQQPSNNENQMKPVPMNGEFSQQQHNHHQQQHQQQHGCSQHNKNQCCIKNYCCKTMNVYNEKPKCCRNEIPSSSSMNRCHCANTSHHHLNAASYSYHTHSNCNSNNIYFGRNISYDLPQQIGYNRCQKPREEMPSCNCCRSNAPQPPPCGSSSKNINNCSGKFLLDIANIAFLF